jgi:hypothetical protein
MKRLTLLHAAFATLTLLDGCTTDPAYLDLGSSGSAPECPDDEHEPNDDEDTQKFFETSDCGEKPAWTVVGSLDDGDVDLHWSNHNQVPDLAGCFATDLITFLVKTTSGDAPFDMFVSVECKNYYKTKIFGCGIEAIATMDGCMLEGVSDGFIELEFDCQPLGYSLPVPAVLIPNDAYIHIRIQKTNDGGGCVGYEIVPDGAIP